MLISIVIYGRKSSKSDSNMLYDGNWVKESTRLLCDVYQWSVHRFCWIKPFICISQKAVFTVSHSIVHMISCGYWYFRSVIIKSHLFSHFQFSQLVVIRENITPANLWWFVTYSTFRGKPLGGNFPNHGIHSAWFFFHNNECIIFTLSTVYMYS